jgi:chromosome segregation ATPase
VVDSCLRTIKESGRKYGRVDGKRRIGGEHGMEKKDIEYKIQDLKADYVRLQQDLEKLEFVKGNLHPLEKQLKDIEEELKVLYKELEEYEE